LKFESLVMSEQILKPIPKTKIIGDTRREFDRVEQKSKEYHEKMKIEMPRIESRLSVRCRDNHQEMDNFMTVFRSSVQTLREKGEWEDKQKALNILTRLLQDSKEKKLAAELFIKDIRNMCVLVANEISNLRTQVSRAAVELLNEMFASLGKAFLTGPTDIDILITSLVKKVGESGGRDTFMQELVGQTLDSMCINQGLCNPARIFSSFYSHSDHKNSFVKAKIAYCIAKILSNPKVDIGCLMKLSRNQSDFGKLLSLLCKYLGDGLKETRNEAKKAIIGLYEKIIDFNILLDKTINGSNSNLIRQVITNNYPEYGIDRTNILVTKKITI
jgi:hypothetical protein